ncbi:probable arabinosyltransferase ARAD1 [Triticum urartu]|uniref:Exostosin GT47 domain-containing protein n=1 Tax=Triticum urartu TaxID=4572 RepID=A0A8R7QFJ2_TRIUA|nr:probable arabinosyltransferase ARAD1 [Triticum urartu]
MVVERKMQPSPPPEHRRVIRFVTFLALSLLAFSCWALVNSRINNAILIADADKTPLLAGGDDDRDRHSTGGDHPASIPVAVPSSSDLMAGAVRMGGPVVRETPLAEGGGEEEGSEGSCDAESAQLRVYLYDLPPEFHFGMLGWDGKEGEAAWPDVRDPGAVPHYPGGLNLQHSVAYWLTLDILSSTLPHSPDGGGGGTSRPCVAVRVTNASLADVFFVPFFASLSYNRHSKLRGRDMVSRNRILQAELVRYLMRQEEWRRWGGKDHLVVPHHPNSMMQARRKLSAAMYVLSDFGRYPPDVANLKKDVIAPYMHVVRSLGDDESPAFEQRPVLAYFQGAIHRKDGGKVRQKLYQLLKDEKDVHFTYGSVRQNGIRRATKGMASSKFCLNIAGDTPSSNRLFDAIVSHCVPVIISDEIELPFEDVLDYSEFCVFVRASDAVRQGSLLRILRGVTRDQWTTMWRRLKEVAHHFEYQYPSKPDDAVQMIWGAVARKMHSLKLQLHKTGRYQRTHSDS